MDATVTDWDDIYVRVVGLRAANQQVKSVAPDQAFAADHELELAATQEIITAHQDGLIDLTNPDFEYTARLLRDTLTAFENTYAVTIFVNDHE